MSAKFRPVLVLAILAAGVVTALGQQADTALQVLKHLPKGAEKTLARIEAHEGKPDPERWHVLVYDKSSENGVREYVITGGEIVASRTISQFAQSLTPDDVINLDSVKMDSHRAAALAQEYALANNLPVATLSYQLRKDGPDAVPLWKVTCSDEAGQRLGALVLTATKGNVISHEGFEVVPNAPVAESEEMNLQPQPSTSVAGAGEAGSTTPAVPATPKPAEVKRKPTKKAEPVRQAERNEKEKPGVFRRVGGSLQKFFTGKDTISR